VDRVEQVLLLELQEPLDLILAEELVAVAVAESLRHLPHRLAVLVLVATL
jgi:hypothetical protein